MAKFKPLTKAKAEKPRTTAPQQKIYTKTPLELSLNININPEYKGYKGTIAELLYSMPKELKDVFQNAKVQSVVCGAGSLKVKLDNSVRISITDIKFANKHKRRVIIKMKGKEVLNKII